MAEIEKSVPEILPLEKIELNSNLKEISTQIKNTKNTFDSCRNRLSAILTEKGSSVSPTDKMSTLINKVSELNIGEGGTGGNISPKITDFVIDGSPTNTRIPIRYCVSDENNQILRHYIQVEGFDKKEITKEVGYETEDKTYRYLITGLNPETSYKIQIIASDGLSEAKSEELTVQTRADLFGVRIDQSNSNPETSVTYIEKAVGLTPANSTGYGDWKDKYPFNLIRKCGFKEGKVYKYINETDDSIYEDGEPVGEDVDIMVEFPKIYWKVTNPEEYIIEILISETKIDEDFICPAHTIGDKEVDNIYIGRYLGWIDELGKLRSLSGKTPANPKSLTQLRIAAQNNGTGYQQNLYYPTIMKEILYTIAFKNLNSQQALGKGYTKASTVTNTGGTNGKGMIYGSQNTDEQICFLGIEDFWGNLKQWLDGVYIDNNKNILISKQDVFNDNGSNYEIYKQLEYTSDSFNGYISKVYGETKIPFLIKGNEGSSTTYFPDLAVLKNGRSCVFGGSYKDNNIGGCFNIRIEYDSSYNYGEVGGRLMYIGS